MEPPNKGHFGPINFGDNIKFRCFVLCRELEVVLSSFAGSKCIRTIGKQIFVTLTFVERSIILIVSLSWREVCLLINVNNAVQYIVVDVTATVVCVYFMGL